MTSTGENDLLREVIESRRFRKMLEEERQRAWGKKGFGGTDHLLFRKLFANAIMAKCLSASRAMSMCDARRVILPRRQRSSPATHMAADRRAKHGQPDVAQ